MTTTTIYSAADFRFVYADFHSGLVTLLHPDGHTMRLTVGELRVASRQDDADLARVYADLYQRAVREIEASRRASIARCAGHRADRTDERGYTGTVYARNENPAAHGNIMEVEYCRCGAERRRNVNQQHVEEGPWC